MSKNNPKTPDQLTLDLIRFRYCLDDNGILRVKERYHSPHLGWREAGELVEGSDNGRGYPLLSVNNRVLKLHHIVWFLHTGVWPESELHHIDRNPYNNHPDNLEEVTASQNLHDRGVFSNNSSGVTGVDERVDKDGTRYWRARVFDQGKRIASAFYPFTEEGKLDAEKYYLLAKYKVAGKHCPVEVVERLIELNLWPINLDRYEVRYTMIEAKDGRTLRRAVATLYLENGEVVVGPNRMNQSAALKDIKVLY